MDQGSRESSVKVAQPMTLDGQDSYKILIRVRGTGLTEKDIKVFLSTFGDIGELVLDSNGKFAVVEFYNRESAKDCLMNSGSMFNGRSIYYQQFKGQIVREENGHITVRPNQERLRAAEGEPSHPNSLMGILNHSKHMEDQMQTLVEVLRLTEEDTRARNDTCECLVRGLSPFFEKCEILQFGSSVNGFGFKNCDLDIFIDYHLVDGEEVPTNKEKKKLSFKGLSGPLSAEQFEAMTRMDKVRLLSRLIKRYQRDRFLQLKPIPAKRCPLVKFYDLVSDINCDLSFNNKLALYNSRLLRLYSSHPVIKLVVMSVRLWAKTQGVCSRSTSSLSTYALTLLVLFFLMRREPLVVPKVWDLIGQIEGLRIATVNSFKLLLVPPKAQLPTSKALESPVELLKGFFQFYANEIDWDNTALLSRNAQLLSIKMFRTQFPDSQVGQMTMLDPFNLSHNVLKNVSKKAKLVFMEEIKRAASLTETWSNLPPEPFGPDPWGVASLLVPNPDPPVLPRSNGAELPLNSKKKKNDAGAASDVKQTTSCLIEGQEIDDRFVIALSPKKVFTCLALEFRAWCRLAHQIIEDILTSVFMVEMDLQHAFATIFKEVGVKTECLEKDQATESPVECISAKRENNSGHTAFLEAGIEETAGEDERQPTPWVISLEESPPATGTSNRESPEFLHHSEDSTKGKTKTRPDNSLPPLGIPQFNCKEKFKALQSPNPNLAVEGHEKPSDIKLEEVDVHTDSTDLIVTRLRDDPDTRTAQLIVRTAAQMKRSRSMACLDKASPESRLSKHKLATKIDKHSSPPRDQSSPNRSKKRCAKKVRLNNDLGEHENSDIDNGKDDSFVMLNSSGCSDSASSSPSVDEQRDDPDSVSFQGTNVAIDAASLRHPMETCQSLRISTYSCTCSETLWHGRAKVRDQFQAKKARRLKGIALEREISKKVMHFQKTHPSSFAAPQGKQSASKKSALNSLLNFKTSSDSEQRQGQSQEKPTGSSMTANSGKSVLALSGSSPSSLPSSSSSSASSSSSSNKIGFSCQITERPDLDDQMAGVHVVFCPHSEDVGHFKNLFISVKPMIERLVPINLTGDEETDSK